MREIIRKLSGRVLAIGLDEELKNIILENDSISECDLLGEEDNDSIESSGKKKRTKKINIRKLRKKYRKKVDYMIVEASVVEKYKKFFARDSMIITNNCIYLYGNTNFDNLLKRYKRTANVTKLTNMKYKDMTIYKIDGYGTKKGRIMLNSLIDNMVEISNNISDFLIS